MRTHSQVLPDERGGGREEEGDVSGCVGASPWHDWGTWAGAWRQREPLLLGDGGRERGREEEEEEADEDLEEEDLEEEGEEEEGEEGEGEAAVNIL